MIKILFVDDHVHKGGSEIVMENIINYLDKDKYDITIASYYREKECIEPFYPEGVHYFSMQQLLINDKYNDYYKFDIRRICAALKRRIYKKIYRHKINKEHYDVVVAMKEGLCMELLQDIDAPKKIGWVHVDYNNLYWTKGLFGSEENEVECMKKYDHIVCVSETTKNSIIKVIGDPGNLVVRENPIDIERIEHLSNAKYKDKILKDKSYMDKTILVTVGRLTEHKNIKNLLKALVRARSIISSPHELWIIGDGEDRKMLEDYAKEYGLKNVKFVGHKDNPYPYIKKADWFVTTTKGESYGLAVQEALILGVPVLATRCKAFEECVTEDEAILIEHTEDDIYAGLVKILGKKKLHKKYKNNIQERNQKELYNERLKDIEELWK